MFLKCSAAGPRISHNGVKLFNMLRSSFLLSHACFDLQLFALGSLLSTFIFQLLFMLYWHLDRVSTEGRASSQTPLLGMPWQPTYPPAASSPQPRGVLLPKRSFPRPSALGGSGLREALGTAALTGRPAAEARRGEAGRAELRRPAPSHVTAPRPSRSLRGEASSRDAGQRLPLRQQPRGRPQPAPPGSRRCSPKPRPPPRRAGGSSQS